MSELHTVIIDRIVITLIKTPNVMYRNKTDNKRGQRHEMNFLYTQKLLITLLSSDKSRDLMLSYIRN